MKTDYELEIDLRLDLRAELTETCEKLQAAELRFANQLEATEALRVKLLEVDQKLELQQPVIDSVENWIDGDFEDYTALSKLSWAFRTMEKSI